MMNMREVFQGRTVLVTGHTGFKGSWLSAWLHLLGAKVVGVALDPPTQPSHFNAANMAAMLDDHRLDIRSGRDVKGLIRDAQPDFVFHFAAQPLVRQSYADPVETYETNVLGTLNVLEALRTLERPCTAVMITSDKCYDNVEWLWGYRETDPLGGSDPYSASKGAAELVIRSHVKSFFPKVGNVRIAIGRAGNVIGGGDWAASRIVPDCVRAWAHGGFVELRNPNSTRPWQHVLEPLSGYLKLAAALYQRPDLHGEPFNFGPPANQNHTVLELVAEMYRHWPKVLWKDVSGNISGPYESGLLKLNCDKALHVLKWHASMTFAETVRMTAEWYRAYYERPQSIAEVTFAQLREYEALVAARGGS
jgi:CDP-glucose 4,6-dehydratase